MDEKQHLEKARSYSRSASLFSLIGGITILAVGFLAGYIIKSQSETVQNTSEIVRQLDKDTEALVEQRQSVQSYLDSLDALIAQSEYERATELTKSIRDTLSTNEEPARTFIHFSSPNLKKHVAMLEDQLRGEGYQVMESQFVAGQSLSESQVRFFFAVDQSSAREVTKLLAAWPAFGTVQLIDMRRRIDQSARVRPGLIEIWLVDVESMSHTAD